MFFQIMSYGSGALATLGKTIFPSIYIENWFELEQTLKKEAILRISFMSLYLQKKFTERLCSNVMMIWDSSSVWFCWFLILIYYTNFVYSSSFSDYKSVNLLYFYYLADFYIENYYFYCLSSIQEANISLNFFFSSFRLSSF
jgi:hypothetical protein